jgi:hypothetical protein
MDTLTAHDHPEILEFEFTTLEAVVNPAQASTVQLSFISTVPAVNEVTVEGLKLQLYPWSNSLMALDDEKQ